MSLAIFDIDLTLTRKPTWRQFLLFANEGKPGFAARLGAAMAPAALAYGLRQGTRMQVKEAALRTGLAGRTEAELRPLAERFVDRLVTEGLRKKAQGVIASHKADGHGVAVATAAVDLIVDPLCDRLGIETRLCTPMAWKDGVLQDHFSGPNCYAEEKERQVRALLEKRGEDLAAFYSDHVSDLGLLKLARRGVAVNPSPALAGVVAAEGLEMEDWDA
ncbi:HAD family hydrolase [Parvularcula dongshanensis]|uniref:HAD superfamily hydrolase (TIGR01490 family) n=1 Tax=Parvularcula dongshanensis TaxID=1173995 RepID=A0A840I3E5_9PROT|nr:HAD superfamily hydrolase (TIGR01490 family) [Parvularcula dongshanensis]